MSTHNVAVAHPPVRLHSSQNHAQQYCSKYSKAACSPVRLVREVGDSQTVLQATADCQLLAQLPLTVHTAACLLSCVSEALPNAQLLILCYAEQQMGVAQGGLG